jgi:hypothetical protein
MASELQTYGDAAIVKSVQEEIEILTPVENLLMKQCRKSTAQAMVHQWQDDTLRAVSSAAAREIETHTPNALSTPTLRTNLIEHVYLAGSVSEAQQKVRHYSGEDEYARQVTKVMMDWSNAAEFDLLRSSLISGVSGTAPRMNGVIRTLSTNVTAQTSGTVFSESILIGLLKLTWDNSNGESATDLLVGSNIKSRISQFTTGLTTNVDRGQRAAGKVVQSYESDYGTVNVHLHRYIQTSGDATARIAGVRMDKFYVAYLVDGEAKLSEYAKTKTSKDFVINGYMTLENRNEKCSFFSSGYLNTF